MESNNGMAQQVLENRTDLLDLLSREELEGCDDLGLTLPYLAVHYDRPEILRYLHHRGLDLRKPCDPLDYGTPLFYAASLGRHHVLHTLYSLGYSLKDGCESYFDLPPIYYARRRDDGDMVQMIDEIIVKEDRATALLRKNILRNQQQRLYQRKRKHIISIQRIARGYITRRFYRAWKAGEEIVWMPNISIFSSSEMIDEERSLKEGSQSVYSNAGSSVGGSV